MGVLGLQSGDLLSTSTQRHMYLFQILGMPPVGDRVCKRERKSSGGDIPRLGVAINVF